MHRRGLEACINSVLALSLSLENVPEYPHSPGTHLKRPTVMRMTGRIIHCEVAFLAGQKKAASGNAGSGLLVLGLRIKA